MAPPTTLYPRATLKKIIKAHAGNKGLSRDADILIFLSYALFLQDLIKESQIASLQSKDQRQQHARQGRRVGSLSARSVRKVRERCLRKFKA